MGASAPPARDPYGLNIGVGAGMGVGRGGPTGFGSPMPHAHMATGNGVTGIATGMGQLSLGARDPFFPVPGMAPGAPASPNPHAGMAPSGNPFGGPGFGYGSPTPSYPGVGARGTPGAMGMGSMGGGGGGVGVGSPDPFSFVVPSTAKPTSAPTATPPPGSSATAFSGLAW